MLNRQWMKWICGLMLVAAGAAASAETSSNPIWGRMGRAPVNGGFRQDDYWVWGSSIIKGDDGKYHMYAERWPKKVAFHPGWMVASDIAHAVSDTMVGPYTFSDVAIGRRSPEYWDGCSQYNPKIFKHGDTYILFYEGSTHPFDDALKHPEEIVLSSKYTILARANERIGVATSKSPYGPWTRLDRPVLDVKPGTFYSFYTSNPTPVVHEDGSVLMIFKSRRYKDQFPYQSEMMLGVAKAPHYLGPYTVVSDGPIFGMEKYGEVEDPYLWKDGSGYHMLAKDQRGLISGVSGAGILAHSKDGIHWAPDAHPLAYDKLIQWDNGTETLMGQMERPEGIFENGKMTHMSFAVMDGPGGFDKGSNTWTVVIPMLPEGAAKK